MKTNQLSLTTRRLLASLLVLVVSISTVFAETTADALQALQSAIETEAAQKKTDDSSDPYGRRGDMGPMFIAQLRSTISRGDLSQIEETLNQIPAILKSEAVRDAVAKLRTILSAEREAKEKAVANRVDSAIAGASKAVQSAKKAADLDETLGNLARMQDNGESRYSEKSRSRFDALRNVRQFVTRWQDYLFNRDTGNLQQAIQNLQSANDNSVDIIPRSEILRKIDELSKAKQPATVQTQETQAVEISAIMEKTKSLDAIPAAIESLTELQRLPRVSNSNFSEQIEGRKKELNAILQAYREYQAGLPAQLSLRQNQGYGQAVEAFNAVLTLRLELLRLTIVRTLGVEENLKPGADETIQKYLDRVMADAQERADARLIGRIKELQDGLTGTQSMGTALAFLQPLLAAQNQEAAGQLVPAVISYQTALKIGGELVPAKAIGIRLDRIKAAHPEDFEKGMQMFLNNTIPAQPQNNYGGMHPSTTVTIPGSLVGKPTPAPSPIPTP
jgi:hypothetical protein